MTEKIRYIGVDDLDIDLFEGQYVVPAGMAYNSYVILDEKTTIMDTVDARKTAEWMQNLEQALDGRQPAYLVVQHLEPDHSGSVAAVAEKYPDMKLVMSKKAAQMLAQFFEADYASRVQVVAEGETLCLGDHTLQFFAAPMVHWPEVIVTYEQTEKVLFSADGFGKFGAKDADEDWACEARRYYFNICGKYGAQVQALLKKAATLDIQIIAPLHGPILTENLGYYLNLYDIWSSYGVETEGVFIAYASIHGNTAQVAETLKEMLLEAGAPKVAMADLSRDDMAEAVEDAFRYGRIVLAAASYDAGVFTPMSNFLHVLQAKNYQKRRVGLIENGSWAPCAARVMKEALASMKEMEIVDPIVTIRSTLKPTDKPALQQLAEAMLG